MDYLGKKLATANRLLVYSDLPVLTGNVTSTPDFVTTVITNANLTGDVTSVGNTSKVVAINNIILSNLTTGILKNTTTTGIPSIAVAADFPTLNQNTTGSSATITSVLPLANGGTGASTLAGVLSNLGLNNVNNTSDVNKPISSAQQTALNLLAPLASPTFTGTPTLPTGTIGVTQTVGNNTTALATTAFVIANATGGSSNLTGDVTSVGSATKVVAINNTTLSNLTTGILKNTTTTGIPSIAVAADFPTLNQNTTGSSATITSVLPLANGGTGASTLAGVLSNLGLNNVNNTSDVNKPISSAQQTALNLLAPLASPTFTGTPTLPTGTIGVTQTVGNNTTALATTAFVIATNATITSSASYKTITSGTETTTSSTTDVVTDMTLNPNAGSYFVNFNAQYSIVAGNQTAQAVTDLTTAYNYLMGLTATNTTHATAFGGETLTAGVYTVPAAGSLAGNLILDGQNNTAATFVFRFGAAFNTGAGTVVSFTRGAQASNVYWVAEGAIGCGATTTMKGTMIAHGAAVSLGASCNLDGRMLSTTGAIGIDTCTLTTPAASSSCNLGVCATFCMFTSNGGLTNAGTTSITGNIGTNSGTITGFSSATISGSSYTAGSAGFATASFSLYQNNTLIPNTTRLRTSTSSNDISLQGITTLTASQSVDVRWSTNLGTVKLQNRILTIVKVT